MQPQPSLSLAAWPADLTPPRGVLVLSGYGLDVRVWRGRLRVADGIGKERREALVHRATGRLRRIVVLGHTGSVSLEALRWLADVGAGYLQLDADGRVLAAFGPQGTDRPGLRRAQARALDTALGVDIARKLIAEKVGAQAQVLAQVGSGEIADATVSVLRDASARLHVAVTRDEIRMAEATAAGAYWSALSGVSVRFARRDAERVPGHWRTLGSRTSPLTGGPRLSVNPANSLLSYLYAVLEGEASIAARIVGLDPGMGVLHADQPNRDSLATDLMEPVRPLVDRYVLELLARRTFAADDFYETRQGVCRITPPLARELVRTSPEWGRAVGRVAEDVARLLEPGGRPGRGAATPLSGRNRSAGRGVHGREFTPRLPAVASACSTCGGPTSRGRQTCSPACETEARAAGLEAFVAAGTATIREKRAVGWQPTMGVASRQRVGQRTSDLVRSAREWQRDHPWPADLSAFTREILPRLQTVSVRTIVDATGLSEGYCRRVRAGAVVPHPMWWAALSDLGVSGR